MKKVIFFTSCRSFSLGKSYRESSYDKYNSRAARLKGNSGALEPQLPGPPTPPPEGNLGEQFENQHTAAESPGLLLACNLSPEVTSNSDSSC